MIVSHKHKFIFIKPTKVAGTSVEVNLSHECGPDDSITPLDEFTKGRDDDFYQQQGQHAKKFNEHNTAEQIQELVSKKVWKEYIKISIIRNPWDIAVSRFFFELSREHQYTSMFTWKNVLKNVFNFKIYMTALRIWKVKAPVHKKNFSSFVKNFHPEWTNTHFYLDKDGKMCCDFLIRYEHLDRDYKKLCKELGIPYKAIPHLKTKTRTEKKHYSHYYNKITRKVIQEKFRDYLKLFPYHFEQKKSE